MNVNIGMRWKFRPITTQSLAIVTGTPRFKLLQDMKGQVPKGMQMLGRFRFSTPLLGAVIFRA
jgi:hypothetical protein